MAYRTVDVTVDPALGTITCNRVRVKKSWRVKWTCSSGYPFTIDFGWDSPFAGEKYHAQPSGAAFKVGNKTVQVDAAAIGKRQRYKYNIAVYVPGAPSSANPDWQNGTVLVEDPEIIIDP